jgi:hypothetical protein
MTVRVRVCACVGMCVYACMRVIPSAHLSACHRDAPACRRAPCWRRCSATLDPVQGTATSSASLVNRVLSQDAFTNIVCWCYTPTTGQLLCVTANDRSVCLPVSLAVGFNPPLIATHYRCRVPAASVHAVPHFGMVHGHTDTRLASTVLPKALAGKVTCCACWREHSGREVAVFGTKSGTVVFAALPSLALPSLALLVTLPLSSKQPVSSLEVGQSVDQLRVRGAGWRLTLCGCRW